MIGWKPQRLHLKPDEARAKTSESRGAQEERWQLKNRLCTPMAYWDSDLDFFSSYRALWNAEYARNAHPAVAEWARDSRLNPLSRIGEHQSNLTVMQTRERIKRCGVAAVGNLAKLVGTAPAAEQASAKCAHPSAREGRHNTSLQVTYRSARGDTSPQCKRSSVSCLYSTSSSDHSESTAELSRVSRDCVAGK